MGCFAVLALVMALTQDVGGGGTPDGSGAAAFGQLKSLVGEWRGTRPDGREIVVNYRLSAGGTVLVETWNLGPQRESLTIYHLHGSDLLATHFCPQGNQPRLRMTRPESSRFHFTFYNATGVEPGQAVQNEFWIEIGAGSRMTRSETYVQGDQAETETITYQRLPV